MTDEFTPVDTGDEDLEAGDEPGTDEEVADDAPVDDDDEADPEAEA